MHQETGQRATPSQARAAAQPGEGGVAGREAPTAARMRLGAQLRHLREAAKISRQDAADALRASASKITRLELGRTGIKSRDLADLLRLYGTDAAERESAMALARAGNDRGWWRDYGDAMAGWRQTYVGLEQSAIVIRGYEPRFVPELFQTPRYARALLTGMSDSFPPHGDIYGNADKTERHAAVLARRQRILRREDSPHVWMVLDEGALRRPVGGPEIMREQLGHLIDVARLTHVNIQVLPLRAGGHIPGGPVVLLRFPGERLPDVACLEHSAGAVYPSRPEEVAFYWDVLNQLATKAVPPDGSIAILERLRPEC